MVRKKLLGSKKPGSVIALVLFAVVLLVLSGVGVLSLGQTVRVFSIRTAAEVAARTAADAGITKAIWQMNAYLPAVNSLAGGDSLANSDGATYTYVVENAASSWAGSGDADLVDFVRRVYPTTTPPGKDDYVVRSIGRYHEAEKVIYATVRLVGCGDTGVLVRDSMILKAGTEVDGRDSRDPTNPDPDVLVEIGTISTDPGAIVLNNGVTVNGNIQVGVGGVPTTVIKNLGATVTGDKYPMTEEPEFPYIYPPVASDTFKYYDTKIEVPKKEDDPNVYFDESMNGRYTMIDLNNKGLDTRTERLIIKSGTPEKWNNVVLHLTNTGTGAPQASISLGQGCEIIVQKNATLNLYVDGNILSDEGSGFNAGIFEENACSRLKLWGNWTEATPTTGFSQDWDLNAKSQYFGQIYAPSASVQVNNSGDLYGAFTAYDFTMMNGGNLFYDGALRDVNPYDEGVRFVLKRWYEQ